jgi:polysaccharide biosynthesis/export protein
MISTVFSRSQKMLLQGFGMALILTTTSITLPAIAIKDNAWVTASDYLLGPGDQIEVQVYGYSEFSGSRVILADGTISLPILGSVNVANQTPDALAKILQQRLDQILVNPTVTVSLSTLRPVVINVAGEVQRPGALQLRSLTAAGIRGSGSGVDAEQAGVPTLSSAIAEAGGITREADIRQVTLRRLLPSGEVTTLTINLWDAIGSNAPSQDVLLRPGDAIFVPKLVAGTEINRGLLARSRLAPTTVKVRVVGEVGRPGEVQIAPDRSLSSAIASAGGFTKQAKPSEVQLLRLNQSGQIETQKLDLSRFNDQTQVQEGDVLVVPEKGRTSLFRTIGEVLNPFNGLLYFLKGL